MARQTGYHVYGIDMLRFFAAFSVSLYHLTLTSWANPWDVSTDLFRIFKPISYLFVSGWIGVQIFFVISGFVIAYTANGRTPFEFARSRLLRLAPGAWLCALLSVPCLISLGISHHDIWVRLIHTVSFFPQKPWVVNAFWTIGVEISFYCVILVTLLSNQFRHAEKIAASLILYGTGLLAIAATFPQWTQSNTVMDLLMSKRAGQLLLAPFAPFFGLGMLIWIISQSSLTISRALLTGVALLGCILQIIDNAALYRSPLLPAIVYFLAGCLIITLSLRTSKQNYNVSPRLARWIRHAGLASYPYYLLHMSVGGAMTQLLLNHSWPPYLALATGLTTTAALSLIIATKAEPICRTLLNGPLAKFKNQYEARMPRLFRHTLPANLT